MKINNQDKLNATLLKAYKDNPIAFTRTVKKCGLRVIFGDYGWYKFWEKMLRF